MVNGVSHAFRYSAGTGAQDLDVGSDGTIAMDGFAVQGAYSYEINDAGQVGGMFVSGRSSTGSATPTE